MEAYRRTQEPPKIAGKIARTDAHQRYRGTLQHRESGVGRHTHKRRISAGPDRRTRLGQIDPDLRRIASAESRASGLDAREVCASREPNECGGTEADAVRLSTSRLRWPSEWNREPRAAGRNGDSPRQAAGLRDRPPWRGQGPRPARSRAARPPRSTGETTPQDGPKFPYSPRTAMSRARPARRAAGEKIRLRAKCGARKG